MKINLEITNVDILKTISILICNKSHELHS